jgi:hypothetical protein
VAAGVPVAGGKSRNTKRASAEARALDLHPIKLTTLLELTLAFGDGPDGLPPLLTIFKMASYHLSTLSACR